MHSNKQSASKATTNNVLIISDLKSPSVVDMPMKENNDLIKQVQKKLEAEVQTHKLINQPAHQLMNEGSLQKESREAR